MCIVLYLFWHWCAFLNLTRMTQKWCSWKMLTEFWWIDGDTHLKQRSALQKHFHWKQIKLTVVNGGTHLIKSVRFFFFFLKLWAHRRRAVPLLHVAAYLMSDSRCGHHGALCAYPLPARDAGLRPSKIKKIQTRNWKTNKTRSPLVAA